MALFPGYSIDHVVIVIDESGSMNRHSQTVPLIVDNLVAHLARRFTELGDSREVRVSVYTFGGRNGIQCLIYDRDVLRLPSIKGHYSPYGGTPLIEATTIALDDLAQTPQKHGDHAFLMYVVTDGEENQSKQHYRTAFPQKLASLPDNWTVGIFVPDARGVAEAKRFGFDKDSISVWDTSKDFSEVGAVIQKTTDAFFDNRSKGIRGTKSLFSLNKVSVNDIKANLTPLAYYQYNLYDVDYDQRIDDFVLFRTRSALVKGTGFYQLTKKETIQDYKQIAVMLNRGGTVYVGSNARQLLGLPNQTVDVVPANYPDYTIFVQSTAPNRKLIRGTKLLLLTPGMVAALSGPNIPDTWTASPNPAQKKSSW